MTIAYVFSKIYSLDDGSRTYTTLVSTDGRISALGGEEILKDYPEAKVVRLSGKTAYPGFFDSHLHVLEYGITLGSCSVDDCEDSKDLITRLKDFIFKRKIAPGQVVWARGFNENKFTDKVLPDRYLLDSISTDHPIILIRACGHLAVANSAMLKKAGIEKGGPIPGGYIDIDSKGIPNGIMREDALLMLDNAQDEFTAAEIKESILRAQAALFSKGISAVCSDDITSLQDRKHYRLVMTAYKELAEEGKLKLRVFEQAQLPDVDSFNQFIKEGHHVLERIGNFTQVSFKILQDGSLGAHTAYLREPYEDDGSNRGIFIYPKEKLEAMVMAAQKVNMPVAVHAIGDGALDMVLDAIEKARNACPQFSPRHAVVHCQITDEAQIARFADLSVIAMIQPIFVATDMLIAETLLGKKRVSTSYNWKRFLENGVHLSFGSDCPVEDANVPANIYCAVTRKSLAGEPEGGWLPDQCLTIGEALRCATGEGAYASYAEDSLGSLEVGKYADMIVLDRDLYIIPSDEIKDVEIVSVIIGGETVYSNFCH